MRLDVRWWELVPCWGVNIPCAMPLPKCPHTYAPACLQRWGPHLVGVVLGPIGPKREKDLHSHPEEHQWLPWNRPKNAFYLGFL